MNSSCDLGGNALNLSCGKRRREGKRRDRVGVDTERGDRGEEKDSGIKPLLHEEKNGAGDSEQPFFCCTDSGQGIEDYDGLVGARDYGFSYGD
jgi:hypothetical protein